MCGIHASISTSPDQTISSELERCLCNRGPDHTGTVKTQLDNSHSELLLTFTSTVLSLRGDHVARQPFVDPVTGSVLCWNGEAWALRGEPVQGNDGEAILALLAEISKGSGDVMDVLRDIEGPFAFIYLDKPAKRLYYGRDRLGRRSLLVKDGFPFSLSSIAEMPVDGWAEVEADGCYTLDLSADVSAGLVPERHDWTADTSLVSSIGVFNDKIPQQSFALEPNSTSVQELHSRLVESLRLRVLDVPLPPNATATDARVAVLFSGGLDCTVLARLCHDMIQSDQCIDLINVAFENPRIAGQFPDLSREELYEKCPDRMTGRNAFAELSHVCPGRTWRFVTVGEQGTALGLSTDSSQVNVPYAENLEHRPEVIRLIHPHNTEMDLSIACALYFAARGRGLGETSTEVTPQPYSTTARVLLSGLGADELFGGYGRHGVAYTQRGYAGVVKELKLDVSRLGKRNLGRDDRAMSHWGREVRFPYLDERFVKWAIEAPVWEKCDFENAGGEGMLDAEKRVLRLVAQSLGMSSVSREKKRAIQFGARTAKMESGKTKGTTLLS